MGKPGWEGWVATTHQQYAKIRGEDLDTVLFSAEKEIKKYIDTWTPPAATPPAATAATAGPKVAEDGWSHGADLYDLVGEMMWRATAVSLFGDGFEAEELRGAFTTFDKHFPLLAAGVPPRFLAGCTDAADKLGAMFSGDVSAVTNGSALMQYRQDYLHKNMNLQDKMAYQKAILWAAFANTVPATFWAVYWTFRTPECLDACRRDIAQAQDAQDEGAEGGGDGGAGGGADAGGADAGADAGAKEGGRGAHAGAGEGRLGGFASRSALNAMGVVDSALHEALRLCTGSLTIREVMANATLPSPKGKKGDDASISSSISASSSSTSASSASPPLCGKIRQGDRVCMYPMLTHMDPEIYTDPNEFKYDRFVGGPKLSKGGIVVPRAVQIQPFGGGVSMCPGRFFAMYEIKIFMASILSAWDIEPLGAVPRLDQTRAGLGILPPCDRVPYRIRRRVAP